MAATIESKPEDVVAELVTGVAKTIVARVLHVVNGEHYAGAERVQDLLAARLPDYGFPVGLACVKPDRFPKLCRARRAAMFLTSMRGRWDLRPAWQLARLVRRQGYRVLHAHTPRTALLGGLASRLAGVPLVYHLHSPAREDSTRAWRDRFNAMVERAGLLRAAAIVAVSESLAAHARQHGFPAELVHVVPNGVPCRAAVGPRSARTGDWILGTVALFRPRKGIEVLLEALALLRAQGLPVRLLAVGAFEDSAYEKHVRARAVQLDVAGAVDWAGFSADVDAYWGRMDLFVLPSLFGEGMPMVLLEAMAAGLPVVASQTDGITDVVRDGEEGLLVEPGRPVLLARAIHCVLQGQIDRLRMGIKARRRQAERFSDRSMAAGVAEIYRRVLEGKGKAEG
jgi:glycosyltransferase involved in cell wall biosynthesis